MIRHNTCRRRTSETQLHGHRSANGHKLWAQTFKRGYVEQTFRKLNVRAELLHGDANQAYLSREDHRLLSMGKVAKRREKAEPTDSVTVTDAVYAPFVWSKEASLALKLLVQLALVWA